jgi:hypothetical protein
MRLELLELRTHFSLSATEALHGMPEWEYDLLVAAVAQEQQEQPDEQPDPDTPPDDPPVPAALKGMF